MYTQLTINTHVVSLIDNRDTNTHAKIDGTNSVILSCSLVPNTQQQTSYNPKYSSYDASHNTPYPLPAINPPACEVTQRASGSPVGLGIPPGTALPAHVPLGSSARLMSLITQPNKL